MSEFREWLAWVYRRVRLATPSPAAVTIAVSRLTVAFGGVDIDTAGVGRLVLSADPVSEDEVRELVGNEVFSERGRG